MRKDKQRTDLLESVDKDFKAAVIKVLNEPITDRLVKNIFKASARNPTYKEDQDGNFRIKIAVIKIKKSMCTLNNRIYKTEERIREFEGRTGVTQSEQQRK